MVLLGPGPPYCLLPSVGWEWPGDGVGRDESRCLPRTDLTAVRPTLVAAGDIRSPWLLEKRGLVTPQESAIFSGSGFAAFLQ